MWIAALLQPVLWRFLELRSDTNARLTADADIGFWLFTDEEADESGPCWIVMLGGRDVQLSASWKRRSAFGSCFPAAL